jgi:hypothetical protein
MPNALPDMLPDPTIAPADAIARRPWPIGKKILAYLLLALLAAVSIWFIDRGAMQLLYSINPEPAVAPSGNQLGDSTKF